MSSSGAGGLTIPERTTDTVSIFPLFWTERFCLLSGAMRIWEYDGTTGIGRIAFSVSENGVVVPGPATFGGLSPTRASVSEDEVEAAWSAFLEDVVGPKALSIRLPPTNLYSRMVAAQNEVLSRLCDGSVTDLNQWIDLTAWTSAAMSRGNRKRTRRFAEVGGKSTRLTHEMDICAAYDLLAANRSRRGVQLSMTADRFRDSLTLMGDKYRCWGSFRSDSSLVAAALTVAISEGVEYVLFWGDSDEGRSMSATAALCEYLCIALQAEGVSQLDLGTSSVDGVVDVGLARFKRNVGAQDALRTTWTIGHGPGQGLVTHVGTGGG